MRPRPERGHGLVDNEHTTKTVRAHVVGRLHCLPRITSTDPSGTLSPALRDVLVLSYFRPRPDPPERLSHSFLINASTATGQHPPRAHDNLNTLMDGPRFQPWPPGRPLRKAKHRTGRRSPTRRTTVYDNHSAHPPTYMPARELLLHGHILLLCNHGRSSGNTTIRILSRRSPGAPNTTA